MKARPITATYTRPANTTQYAANDALSDGTVLEFVAAAPIGKNSGIVLGATIISSANQTTLPEFKLYLFDTEPTPVADNAEFDLPDSEAQTLICSLTLDGFSAVDVTSGTNGNAMDAAAPDGDFPIPYLCGTESRSLFGLLKVTNDYTPISSEVITVRLHLEQD